MGLNNYMEATTRHHEIKTYRNQPACAGSGEVPTTRSCSVCGRSDVGTHGRNGRNRSTHLHANDLAAPARTSAPVVDAVAVAQANAKAHWAAEAAADTADEIAAIAAFAADQNADTFHAMIAACGDRDWPAIAKRNGIEVPR
jgi:hypothetical protein